jgi:hypothetical protein
MLFGTLTYLTYLIFHQRNQLFQRNLFPFLGR